MIFGVPAVVVEAVGAAVLVAGAIAIPGRSFREWKPTDPNDPVVRKLRTTEKINIAKP